jgi:hypothetical protein
MSKLAHSDQETMDIIEAINLCEDEGDGAFEILEANGFDCSRLPIEWEKRYAQWLYFNVK